MATALAAQLDQLAAGREERVRGRASLLYAPQQAADVDLQAIYADALAGACCPVPVPVGLTPAFTAVARCCVCRLAR